MSLVRLLKEQFFIDDDTEVNGADLVDFLAEYLETVPEIEGSLNVRFWVPLSTQQL